MIRGKELEKTVANTWFFFVDYGVACAVDEHLGFDDSRQWDDLAADFEGVGHGQGVRMARNGNHVFGPKHIGLFQDFSADFRESEPVGGGIEILQATGVLNRLERDAANAWLREGKVNHFADFAVVQALLQGHDQRSGDLVLIQILQGALAHTAKIPSPQVEERFALKRIELQVHLEA